MILDNLPGLIVAVPLIMSAIVALLPNGKIAWVITLLTVAATLYFALLNGFTQTEGSVSYALGGWPPPWGIEFISDGTSRMMAVILAGLSFAATLYAKALIEIEIHKKDQARTYGAWLLNIGGLLGLVMTADAFNLFVFLEISALSAVTLVAMGAGVDRRALIAAYNYLIIGAIGATFYVIGVGFCYAVTGTLNMADLAQRLPEATLAPVFVGLAFMVTGIMVKAAAFPVHIWLPAAYGYAPNAVSSLLAAIATKAAIYVLARVLFTVFGGLPEATDLILTWIIMPLSLMAMFAGTILAIYESDLKKLLAQSSIAQIGYITLAFSIATTSSISAGFIHMANHALIKGGMFMAVGGLAVGIGRRANINSISGLGRAMPWTSATMLVCGLSLIGLPLTAGFISKIYLVLATLDAGLNLITALILISSALSVLYLWKMVEVMWMRPYEGKTIAENPWVYGPLWLVALANIVFGVYAAPIVEMADAAARALTIGHMIGGQSMMMSVDTALKIGIFAPLISAILVPLFAYRINLRDAVGPIGGVITFIAALHVAHDVLHGGTPSWTVVTIAEGLSLSFKVTPLGAIFGLVASGLWILAALYTTGYMRGNHETHQTRFAICYAIAVHAAMAIAWSGNLMVLFIFYEILTFSTYPLVTHKESQEAIRAGRLYMSILVGTSVILLLPAIIWVWISAGTLDFTPGGILSGKVSYDAAPWLLALFAFGVGKAALMPIHRWLPAAMVAPTPVSALLHAVAVVKAGVFTILMVAVYIFGIDFLASSGASIWLAWLAAFTILASSVIAMTKDDLKARLAYSTISQLSYIVLGAALATAAAVEGAALHIVMHASAKITLFFCAGAIYVNAHIKNISELDGLGFKLPLVFIAFFLGALSIIGIPPMGGSWSKFLLMAGSVDANMPMMLAVLAVSSLLNVYYLLEPVSRGFFKPAKKDIHVDRHVLTILPPVITAILSMLLFFTVDWITPFTSMMVTP